MGGWPDHELYELVLLGRSRPRPVEVPDGEGALKFILEEADRQGRLEDWCNVLLSGLVHIWVDFWEGDERGPHRKSAGMAKLLEPLYEAFDGVAEGALVHPRAFRGGGGLVRLGGPWLTAWM
jgi:hypothetical protein